MNVAALRSDHDQETLASSRSTANATADEDRIGDGKPGVIAAAA